MSLVAAVDLSRDSHRAVSLFIQSCNLIKGEIVIWVLFTAAVLHIARWVYADRVRSSGTLNSVNLVDYGSSLCCGE